MVMMDEDKMRGEILSNLFENRNQLVLVNERTKHTYILHVLAQVGKDEYCIEFYESRGNGSDVSNSDTHLLVKNNIRITKPVFPRKRMPAVSAILGVVILLGVAAGVGAIFFSTAVDTIDDSFFEVNRADAVVFSNDSGFVYLEISISSSDDEPLLLAGDISPPVCLIHGCRGTDVDSNVLRTSAGFDVAFDGVVELERNVSPGGVIVLEFSQGSNSYVSSVEVRHG